MRKIKKQMNLFSSLLNDMAYYHPRMDSSKIRVLVLIIIGIYVKKCKHTRVCPCDDPGRVLKRHGL
jgi:hypothetical protein